jgi:hypothetical protein
LHHCHRHLRFTIAWQVCERTREDGGFAGHHRPEAERRNQALSDFCGDDLSYGDFAA